MIDSILEDIRKRSAEFNDEERRPHHFSFDLRSHPDRPVEVVVLGLNPGESVALAPPGTRHPGVAEESSRFNFQDAVPGGADGSSKRWKTRLARLVGDRSLSFSNLFFWSSRDSHKAFVARFGVPIHRHPWLGFCARSNLRLIEEHRPKLVLLMGLGHVHRFAGLYDVEPREPIRSTRGRLAIPLSGRSEPWLAVKHPTGARMSQQELALARAEVDRRLLS